MLSKLAPMNMDAAALIQFQRNARARRGFRLIEETDGARNEEREPDARYLWARTG